LANYELQLPIEEEARKLRIRDTLYLTGEICTIRDMAYERILSTIGKGEGLPFDLSGRAIWHCGPIVKKRGEGWEPVSVGSTTSSRFTHPATQVIEKLGVKLIIGKGYMGKEVMPALSRNGAAYAITTGGTAAYYAEKVEEVKGVHWLDLGMPAAVWLLSVRKLGPLIVGLDSKGGNMFEEVGSRVSASVNQVYREFGIDPDHRYVWWP